MSKIVDAVLRAIDEIRLTFDSSEVIEEGDRSGGAIIVVTGIPLGKPYVNSKIWMGFRITYQYPYADVYPHFTTPDLRRIDKQGLGSGFGDATFRGEPAIQISRRSNRLDPNTDTAALKLLKVIRWMKSPK